MADVKIAVDYDNKIYKKKFNIEDFAHRYRREAKIRHRQNELEFQHIKKSNNNLKNTIKRNSNLIILILTGVILLSTVMTTSSIICKLFTLIENSKLKKIDYLFKINCRSKK